MINYNNKKSLQKSDDNNVVPEFATFAQKELKVPFLKKIVFFLVFSSKFTVHIEGTSRGRVCGYGCWSYQHVTGET